MSTDSGLIEAHMAAVPAIEVSHAEWDEKVTEEKQDRMYDLVNDFNNIPETYAVQPTPQTGGGPGGSDATEGTLDSYGTAPFFAGALTRTLAGKHPASKGPMEELDSIAETDRAVEVLSFVGYATDPADAADLALAYKLNEEETGAVIIRSIVMDTKSALQTRTMCC